MNKEQKYIKHRVTGEVFPFSPSFNKKRIGPEFEYVPDPKKVTRKRKNTTPAVEPKDTGGAEGFEPVDDGFEAPDA